MCLSRWGPLSLLLSAVLITIAVVSATTQGVFKYSCTGTCEVVGLASRNLELGYTVQWCPVSQTNCDAAGLCHSFLPRPADTHFRTGDILTHCCLPVASDFGNGCTATVSWDDSRQTVGHFAALIGAGATLFCLSLICLLLHCCRRCPYEYCRPKMNDLWHMDLCFHCCEEGVEDVWCRPWLPERCKSCFPVLGRRWRGDTNMDEADFATLSFDDPSDFELFVQSHPTAMYPVPATHVLTVV